MQLLLAMTSVRFSAALRGGEYQVRATVRVEGRTAALSDPAERFPATTTRPVATRGGAWRATIEANDPTARIELEVVVTRIGGVEVDRFVHAWPASVYYRHVSLGGRQVTVELSSQLPDGRQRPENVIYARRHPDGVEEHPLVVSAPRVTLHMEIDPVVPSPLRPELTRPAFVYALGTHRAPLEEEAVVAAPSALNPAVIPAWAGSGAPSSQWLSRWGARVAGTVWYRGALAMSDLRWSAETLEGNATVAFAGGNDRGRIVTVYGLGSGEVALHTAYRGRRVATYRALVRRPVAIRTRFVVKRPVDDAASREAYSATEFGQGGDWVARYRWDNVLAEMDVGAVPGVIASANAYLRQVGVELVADPSHPHLDETVPMADTVLIDEARLVGYLRPYAVDNVLTFVVAHSLRGRGTQSSGTNGITPILPRSQVQGATDPGTGALDSVTAQVEIDRGSPSSSWAHPCGAPPNPSAEPTTRTFFVEANPVGNAAVVCLFSGDRGFDGQTAAHETGHALNLAHFESSNIGVQNANLMQDGAGENDLDIAQAKIIWHSPLVLNAQPAL